MRSLGRGNVLVAVGIVTLVGCLVAPTPAVAGYAPLDQRGPKLTEPRAKLAASLACSANLGRSKRKPVLLLAGTGVNSHQNFAFNYIPALRAAGIPYCTSDPPGREATNLGDIQTRAEYVVFAIRNVYRRANRRGRQANRHPGRRIAVLGHSQGGMIPRWALRFWPYTRRMVGDVVGLAAPNHGSASPAGWRCDAPDGCWPAVHQQLRDARFIAALNSRRETFRRISYTQIYTRYDELVWPPESSAVNGPGPITNILLQDVCPASTADHASIVNDPLAYALARDAIAHRGPADPGRLDDGVCSEQTIPGTDPLTSRTGLFAAIVDFLVNVGSYPPVSEEPPLRCYVTASC